MAHGGYGISASQMDSRVASLWPSVITDDVLERLATARLTFGYGDYGYGIVSAYELDSRVASRRRSIAMTIDLLQRLQHAYPAGATYGYGRTPPPAAHRNRLVMRYQNGVWEYFDEHGAVIRVDYGDDDPYGRGRFGAVPASEAEIARLPKATAGELRGRDCAVCLESFKEQGEELRKMTCPSSHGFHEHCIFKWLRLSRLCPLCRFALAAEQDEEDDDAESDEETEEEVDIEEANTRSCETLTEPTVEESGAASTAPAEEESGACQHTE